MDEIVCHLQSRLKKIALDGLSSLSVWMGVARRRSMTDMDSGYRIMQSPDEPKTLERTQPESKAEVIEFYIPSNFVRPVRWIPSWRRGKVLPFNPDQKKTA